MVNNLPWRQAVNKLLTGMCEEAKADHHRLSYINKDGKLWVKQFNSESGNTLRSYRGTSFTLIGEIK